MRIWFAFVSLIVDISTTSNVWSAPITFNTALPVGGGEFVAREIVVVNESGRDPSGANRDRNATSFVSVLGYGVTNKLALFGVLPYIDKDLDVTVAGNRINRSESGLGDVSVFGRYTVVQRDQLGSTFRVAPFFGVKAPTSDDDERDRFGRLPPSVQSGTGAWDVFGGVVGTYQTLDFQTDGQVSYRINNKANNFEPGNELRLDGSLQYRLLPRTLGDGVPSFLYGVLETNFVYRDKNKVNNSDDDNSGGTTLFLSPGLQCVTKRWIVEGVVQFPVIQNLHGNALENDYAVRAGVRFNF
jgi:hypothetical protein